MARNSSQAQRDYITSLITRIGVEAAFNAGALTIDQAVDQGRVGGFREPRDVARHCNSIAVASDTITKLKAMI